MPDELQQNEQKNLPVARAQDVEFSMEMADEEDMEALERMEAADKRQKND